MNAAPVQPDPGPPEVIVAARLCDFTTFQLGGPCRRLVICRTPGQVVDVLRDLRARGEPVRVMGGGSNLLVADRGLDEVVVRFVSEAPAARRREGWLEVDAGTGLDALAVLAAELGLDGLGFAHGIPGTVGGAVAGNAGAFGEQMSDRLEAAELLDPAGGVRWWTPAELGFAYRQSAIPALGAVILRVRLNLAAGDPERLKRERAEVMAIREARHPDWRTIPCAGSFFRNLEPTSAAERRQAAGWFLEQTGAKQMRVGGAAVYAHHANMPYKAAPECTAADVRELSRRMATAVRERFGIELVPEVQLIGFAP